jgi:hypothetical protein
MHGHCEHPRPDRGDAAIQEHEVDCFAALAMTRFLALAALMLAACHQKHPPAPTAEQSAQLNDAEDMLNNAANEEGPEQRPGPSNSSD